MGAESHAADPARSQLKPKQLDLMSIDAIVVKVFDKNENLLMEAC
jgi:hypothetical protein